MDITKQDFGRFLTDRRRAAGLTQRQLAAQLHVTESAVSKWERGISYPDITLVQAIAAELGVSAQELISASEDREGRADKRDARSYRGWRSAILWTTLLSWATTILACFIVNLSVQHTLSWFWIVLPAVGIGFCLTTLPLLRVPHPGWLALGGATVSLLTLLLVVWLQFSGGPWLVVAASSVLFGLLIVFSPIWLAHVDLPEPLSRHRTVLALAIDTLALVLLLLVILVALGRPELWARPALPIAGIAAAPIWIGALLIRYLPLPGLAVATVVTALAGVCALTIDPAIAAVLGEQADGWALDLGTWDSETIDTNIRMLVFIAVMAAALLLGVAAVAQALRRSGPRAWRSS